MNLQDTELLANDLFRQFSLDAWIFKFDGAKRRFGQCSYRHKTISLSRHYVTLNDWFQIEKTLRHEIAHALVGPGHGHDYAWKRKCIETGAEPVRCFDQRSDNGSIVKVVGKLTYECPTCHNQWKAHKRWTVTKYCTSCFRRFRRHDKRSLLTLIDSGNGLTDLFAELENK